jgi:hypothetical protein
MRAPTEQPAASRRGELASVAVRWMPTGYGLAAAGHSAAKDFAHIGHGQCAAKRNGENPMDDYVSPPLNFTFGAILRVGVLLSLVWIIGDALDGGSQSLLPPLLVAAWLYVMVVLDRWVQRRR